MKRIIILFVFSLAFILRFWQLDKIPPGLNVDEVSEGYNAYSLIKTGKDRYGMAFPIMFKSFGSYQAPIYTYLTTIPVAIFGLNIFSVKVVTFLSGVAVVVLTFLITNDLLRAKGTNIAITASLIVAISPWAIFFSRMATETSPALAIFLLGFYLSLKSLKNALFFPVACLVFGLATHTYYSERITVLLFISAFIYLNRRLFFSRKKLLVIGILVFIFSQLPHLFILKSGALTKRFEQVTYLNEISYDKYAKSYKNTPFGKINFVGREFASQYATYFSPRNLFFDPDPQEGRSIPDLSVFYAWMIIPFFMGLSYLLKSKELFLKRNIFLLMFISPIPAALSGDPFYTLRVLTLLWVFSVVIAFGLWSLLTKLRQPFIRFLIFSTLIVLSLFSFYKNYFVLFKFERAHTVGFADMEVIKITEMNPGQKYVVDLSRDISTGLRFAVFRNLEPNFFQKEIGGKFLSTYYTKVDHETEYNIYNVEVRAINWNEDLSKDQILVGDPLAISDNQVKEHNLKLVFEVNDMKGKLAYRGFLTQRKD